MKYKLAIAVMIVAALVLSVIPMVSDDSDAYAVKEGETGVGFSVKNMSGDNLKKILPESKQLNYAKNVMYQLLADTYTNYEYTDVEVSEYSMEMYYGSSISDDNHHNRVGSSNESYKITFKATRTDAAEQDLFKNQYQNEQLIKAVGVANKSQEGAYFEVTAHVVSLGTEHSKITYAINSEGDPFVTHDWTKAYDKNTLEADVKYTFDSGTKSVTYKVDMGSQKSGRYDVTMDFGDVAIADVRNTTRVLMDTKVDQYGALSWNKVKVGDGEEKGYSSYNYNPDESERFHAYRNVAIFHRDIAPTYAFYDPDATVSLYGEYSVDESLRDDAKLKQFLADNGTVKDTFDSVEKGADSLYQDMTFTEDLKQVGLILGAAFIAFIVTVVIVVIIVLLIKKKK